MSEDRCQEDQEEEDKKGKQYTDCISQHYTVKIVKVKQEIAMLCQTGVSKISIVYSLKFIRITSN